MPPKKYEAWESRSTDTTVALCWASALLFSLYVADCLLEYESPASLEHVPILLGIMLLALITFLLPTNRTKIAAVLLVTSYFASIVAASWLISYGPRHTFMKEFLLIRPGMTVEQVEHRIAPYRDRGCSDIKQTYPANYTGKISFCHTQSKLLSDFDAAYIEFVDGEVTRTNIGQANRND